VQKILLIKFEAGYFIRLLSLFSGNQIFYTKTKFMEQNQGSSLFGLEIDAAGKSHLSEAARWAKFLAIIGMVMCGFMVIGGILVSTAMAGAMNDLERGGYGGRGAANATGMGATMMVTYIIIAVIYFFPCMFTLRFANHMKSAIGSDDKASLNESFKNLKVTFRYMGIITIVFLSLFLLMFLFGGMAYLMGGR
jgi:uncharacterized membrane protein YjgN (DUF898 family)